MRNVPVMETVRLSSDFRRDPRRSWKIGETLECGERKAAGENRRERGEALTLTLVRWRKE